MSSAPLVSVILSFRNEAEVIPELIRRLQIALTSAAVDHELIFVNDDSTDNSLTVLSEWAARDTRIKIINMSRRFGVSECALAGMERSRGEAVVYMDADLQDPPELIPELIIQWHAGADVVYTVRANREGESPFKLWLTRQAYRVINSMSDTNLPVEAGDFKLISRRAVKALLGLHERNPYMRGLVTWIGFKQVPVYYTRHRRAAGVSHFPLFRSRGPITTFVYGFTSFSILPLAAFLIFGLLVLIISAIATLVALAAFLFGIQIPEWTIVAVLLIFSSGVQLVGIGTLGLYLGRVFTEVRQRPHYIIESVIGFDENAK